VRQCARHRQRHFEEGHKSATTAEEHARNGRRSLKRRLIERVFAHFKNGNTTARALLGLLKNQLELTLKAVTYNLRRLSPWRQLKPGREEEKGPSAKGKTPTDRVPHTNTLVVVASKSARTSCYYRGLSQTPLFARSLR